MGLAVKQKIVANPNLGYQDALCYFTDNYLREAAIVYKEECPFVLGITYSINY